MKVIHNLIFSVTRHNDIALAILVVMIISLMIIPIEPWMLDTLLTINLTLAIVLLMMALYIPRALAFSTFPSMLLFTTLFRLSLNITTTRLILTKAYAGEIINTFGNFVVAGNFIVGAVIFLIILIVQFIVITKGAERVAEVAARFTLDAMPGKQMSIDADLRAGTLTMEVAKKRRSELEKENQLYGAMDGAMKFVKGDAIAGLIIVAINILAGLAIGMLQKGMSLDKAVTTYSILTIGDGLITQIPALIISITAGVIVTRVSSDEEIPLGGEIGQQVLAQPKALMIGSAIILVFSLVPGFPKPQFMALSLGVFLTGLTLTRVAKARTKKKKGSMPAMAPSGKDGEVSEEDTEGSGEDFSVSVPLMLDVSTKVQTGIKPDAMNAELVSIRRALYHDLGVPFPGIHLRYNDSIDDNAYQILLQEVPISQGMLLPGHILVRESTENLQILNIPFVQGKAFLPNIPTIWVEQRYSNHLAQASIPYMDLSQVLTYHLSFVLKRYAGEFIGIQETRFLLEHMEHDFGEIVREVQRVLPIQKIAEVFQRLVQEEISIRNLRTILQALIDWGQKEKEPVLLTEYCRSSLKRYISYKFSGGYNILSVYLLEPEVEEVMRKAIRQTSAGSYLALDPKTAKKIQEAVRNEVGDLSRLPQKPVLLTAMDLRRYMRKLIELELYELPVLSHQELTDEITIQPLGRVSI
ncbi:MAG: SctV family type III secretion system export apparatus subunit BcrD [Opitutales bacterium]